MADAADVDALLLALFLVHEELALYLDAVLQGGVVHAARAVQRPAVSPLALEVVLRVVGAHGVDHGAGGGAYEAAFLSSGRRRSWAGMDQVTNSWGIGSKRMVSPFLPENSLFPSWTSLKTSHTSLPTCCASLRYSMAGFDIIETLDVELNKKNYNARPRSMDKYYETAIIMKKTGARPTLRNK